MYKIHTLNVFSTNIYKNCFFTRLIIFFKLYYIFSYIQFTINEYNINIILSTHNHEYENAYKKCIFNKYLKELVLHMTDSFNLILPYIFLYPIYFMLKNIQYYYDITMNIKKNKYL